jgi:putative phosphoribosyl transferase
VLALPRGGVPVGFEVARALGAPLDIGLVRKLGAPMQPELGIGALGEGGEVVVDPRAFDQLGISRDDLDRIVERETRELERRRDAYRPGHPALDVADRLVVLVDDGLATGVTASAAARVLKARGAREVLLAVPVCPSEAEQTLKAELDGFVCLRSPSPFYGVGGAYDDFTQTTDREVVGLLATARATAPPARSSSERPGAQMTELEVAIPAGPELELAGTLRIPAPAGGLVVFAHGSGSSRLSARNRAVAERLNTAGFATLLFDLLSEREAAARANVFDIDLLASRLLAAIRFTESVPALRDLPIGLFGASTGAAAALRAATLAADRVVAIVSRGGRPDLAGPTLAEVVAPTLLIVGGEDHEVLALNRTAAAMLAGPHELAVIPGAGHLFEESDTLAQAAERATAWFARAFLADSGPAGDPGATGRAR